MKKKKMNINPNPVQSESQLSQIKKALISGQRITPLDALKAFGCLRLGARIWDLQQSPHGLLIKKEMVLTSTGKRVAEYSLL